ncbi:MAG: DUF2812 domain-containing protein [Tissierellia bacterium]|nr:DUF2812 domain-containing protein [Tissierellia bacterium]
MRKIKFFKDPISDIKTWLNDMSDIGYRLVGVRNFIYDFEKSDKKYYYETQFIGYDPTKENNEYIDMLNQSGKKVYRAPINQGNVNLIKFRLRPLAKGDAKFANTFGGYNKEILIVESEKEEELFTDYSDISIQYKKNRDSYLQGLVVFAIFLIISMLDILNIHIIAIVIMSIIFIWLLYLTLKNHQNYIKYNKLSKISER